MADEIRVVMNRQGVEEVLNDPAVTGYLMGMASSIKASCDAKDGDIGYSIKSHPGRKGGRQYVDVAAVSVHAIRANAKKNTILKSMDAGRR